MRLSVFAQPHFFVRVQAMRALSKTHRAARRFLCKKEKVAKGYNKFALSY